MASHKEGAAITAPSSLSVHGGRRDGAGRKPLPNGIERRLFSLTPRHSELLEQYRQRHQLASASAAIRHLLENSYQT